MKYTPHTEQEIKEMLAKVGVNSLEELFSTIPDNLKYKKPLEIEEGKSEVEVMEHMNAIANAVMPLNEMSFLGGGCYPDFIPHIVDHFSGLGEFLTAYTPYQPEASQGTLQVIFEFQTLMARLLKMDVANASMYDGATATVEAAFMALSAQKNRNKVIAAGAIHYEYKQVLKTYFKHVDSEVEFIDEDPATGRINPETLKNAIDANTAGVIVQNPNFLGLLEDMDDISKIIHDAGALLISVVEPVSLGILKTPGEYEADIAIGEGQPLGAYANYGGPGFGFFSTRDGNFKKGDFMRKMPGRIVSRTVDTEGKPAYALALQTREQHIRRAKATSNICTNQGIMAFRALVYMSMFGKEGFYEQSERVTQLAHFAAEKISAIDGFSMKYDTPFFREFVIQTPDNADTLFRKLAMYNIYPGIPLVWFYPERENELLVSVSTLNTADAIDKLAKNLKNLA